MSQRKISLEQYEVVEPCTISWESMPGNERTRFCAHCNKHVHRTSAMSRSEAESLLCEPGERVCAILEHDDTGRVLTLDYAPRRPARRSWLWPITAVGTAMTALIALVSCNSRSASPVTTRPTLVPGEIAPIRAVLLGKIASPTTARMGEPSATPAPSTQPQ